MLIGAGESCTTSAWSDVSPQSQFSRLVDVSLQLLALTLALRVMAER